MSMLSYSEASLKDFVCNFCLNLDLN
jgi:hypothetical protein